MSQPSRVTATARREATPAEARALAHPDRLRIIRLTFDEALTNKQLAERLGRNPGTSLYHLRMLVATGFVAAEEPRRGARNASEVPYRSTGKSWTLDVGEPSQDTFSAVVDAFRTEILESPIESRRTSRLALRLSAERRAELDARLQALVEEAAAWPRGSRWRTVGALRRDAREGHWRRLMNVWRRGPLRAVQRAGSRTVRTSCDSRRAGRTARRCRSPRSPMRRT